MSRRRIPRWPIRPHLLALLLAPACADNAPAISPDMAQTADLARSVDFVSPHDYSDQEYVADIDGGRLMGGDCLARPIEPCDPADGGMPDRDPAARHLSALLEACGDSMLPFCSTLRVQYDKNGCAIRVEYYGDNRAFPVIQCTTAKLDRARSACAFDRTVTVVGFCE